MPNLPAYHSLSDDQLFSCTPWQHRSPPECFPQPKHSNTTSLQLTLCPHTNTRSKKRHEIPTVSQVSHSKSLNRITFIQCHMSPISQR